MLEYYLLFPYTVRNLLDLADNIAELVVRRADQGVVKGNTP